MLMRLLLCWACCLCATAALAQASSLPAGDNLPEGLFNAKRLAEFKSWVVNHANCDTIAEMPADKLTYEDVDDTRANIVYVDTLARTIPFVLRLQVKPNGKIEGCRVEGLSEEIFVKRVERAVSRYPDNIFDSRALKASGLTEVPISLSLPLAGNYIVITDGLYRLAENEEMAGSWRIPQLRGPLTMWQHAYTVYCAIRRIGNRNSARTAGTITFSFVIATNGYETGFVKYDDRLYPAGVFEEWGRNESEASGFVANRRYANRMDWTPARVAGQDVPIRVVMHCDYQKEVYGWRCYLMTAEEERMIPRQTEMQNK